MTLDGKKKSRREFLADSALAAAGVVAAASGFAPGAAARPGVLPRQSASGANDRINLAIIGIRSRGMQLASSLARQGGVRIKTLVDPDETLFAERVLEIEKLQQAAPGVDPDLRRALEDKDIDAVVIAAPDHWHALATIWACEAGKHVYVEKPCSHNVWEGRQMVAAARRHGRIVAVGFQNRSIPAVRRAMQFLHDGGIGGVYMARGLCFKPRDSIGRQLDGAVPAGVDYDLWLGCAPARPFNPNRFHYNWHWFWDYGCGDIGNQGPHQFDIARWGLGETGHPARVSSTGGCFAWDSDQETPNTQSASFEYASGKVLQFDVRGLYTNSEDGITIGNLFYGTKGWMHVNGGAWKTYFGRKNEPGPGSDSPEEQVDPANLAGSGEGGHLGNFIAALRKGDRGVLTSEIEEGHISTALPHLANIACRVGADLRFDGNSERFRDNAEANRLLTRDYREPFTIPEIG